jgi:hypothetical protein
MMGVTNYVMEVVDAVTTRSEVPRNTQTHENMLRSPNQ